MFILRVKFFLLIALCFDHVFFSSDENSQKAASEDGALLNFIKDPSKETLLKIDEKILKDGDYENSLKKQFFVVGEKNNELIEFEAKKFSGFLENAKKAYSGIGSNDNDKFKKVFEKILLKTAGLHELNIVPLFNCFKIEYKQTEKEEYINKEREKYIALRIKNYPDSIPIWKGGWAFYRKFIGNGAGIDDVAFMGGRFYYIKKGFDKIDKFNCSLKTKDPNEISKCYLSLNKLKYFYSNPDEILEKKFNIFEKNGGTNFLNKSIEELKNGLFIKIIKNIYEKKFLDDVKENKCYFLKKEKDPDFELFKSICEAEKERDLFKIIFENDYSAGLELNKLKKLRRFKKKFNGLLSDVKFELDGKIFIPKQNSDLKHHFAISTQQDGTSKIDGFSDAFNDEYIDDKTKKPINKFGENEGKILYAFAKDIATKAKKIEDSLKKGSSFPNVCNLFKYIKAAGSSDDAFDNFKKALLCDSGIFDTTERCFPYKGFAEIFDSINEYNEMRDGQEQKKTEQEFNKKKLIKINGLKSLLELYIKNNPSSSNESNESLVERLSKYEELLKNKATNAEEIKKLDDKVIYFNCFFARDFLKNLAVELNGLILNTYNIGLQKELQIYELNSKKDQIESVTGIESKKDFAKMVVQGGIQALITSPKSFYDNIIAVAKSIYNPF